jgi:hypothetical protein
MAQSKVPWALLSAGGGGLGLSGVLAMEVAAQASPEVLLGTCITAVWLGTITAIVTIVKIRTDRTIEARRAATLGRLARRHNNPDRAMTLIMMAKPADKASGLTNEQVFKAISNDTPSRPYGATSRDPAKPKRTGKSPAVVTTLHPSADAEGQDDTASRASS